jgi:serine/threonine-protein kinase
MGAGGFAWVYAATDPDLGITLALKVLKPQFAGDPAFQQRFRREASTAAKLKHPNIIKIYAVGGEGDSVYFAMDLFTQKLTQQIGVMGALPEPAVLKLGLDVASALAFAHRQGVVHRDIKADNILFDDHGNAIVTDFGIARAVEGIGEQTKTNVIMGTPQFFAPEQARGLRTDARADIYSLGVTLFLAATGELPFKGEDWYEIATKHVQEPPPSPRSINPTVSPELEQVILRCLEKEREQRFQTADELYAELEVMARKRASESSAATILVSTPVTGRYVAIRPPRPSFGRRIGAMVVFVGALAAAGATFRAVDILHRRSMPSRVFATQSVATAPLDSGGVTRTDSAGGPTGTAAGAGPPDTGAAAAGGSAQTVGSRFQFAISAPTQAELFVDGYPVGFGSWQTDTLEAGQYHVAAQIPVARDCIWGRDSTDALFSGTGPLTISLRPLLCGALQVTATKANGDSVDARYEVLSGTGTLLAGGRLPMDLPVALPTGTHWLSIKASYCSPFGDSIAVAADSTVRKGPIRLICTASLQDFGAPGGRRGVIQMPGTGSAGRLFRPAEIPAKHIQSQQ